jgi:hypothetical protein
MTFLGCAGGLGGFPGPPAWATPIEKRHIVTAVNQNLRVRIRFLPNPSVVRFTVVFSTPSYLSWIICFPWRRSTRLERAAGTVVVAGPGRFAEHPSPPRPREYVMIVSTYIPRSALTVNRLFRNIGNHSLQEASSGPWILILEAARVCSGTDSDSRVQEVPMLLLRVIWAVVQALFSRKADLVAENLAPEVRGLLLDTEASTPVAAPASSDPGTGVAPTRCSTLRIREASGAEAVCRTE